MLHSVCGKKTDDNRERQILDIFIKNDDLMNLLRAKEPLAALVLPKCHQQCTGSP